MEPTTLSLRPEVADANQVLMADDSHVMRSAIRKTLEQEPRIELVAEAATFAETIQKIADYKPAVLLLDLHLPEKQAFAPELVKAQLRGVCTLAVSLSNDDEARALAESYGAVTLLDKMTLYNEMVPAILRCESRESDTANLLRKPFKPRTQARSSDAGSSC